MIRIETVRTSINSYDLEVSVQGPKFIVIQQLTAILNDLYKWDSEVFERALLDSKYTEDHT